MDEAGQLRQSAKGCALDNLGYLQPAVLVAEDSEDDFFLVQRAFNKWVAGAQLTRFKSGDEILAYLSAIKQEKDRFNAILLLDLKLPGASGFEVLKWVREDAVLNRLVVNILSSSCEPADIEKAYALGANAFMTKPMDLAQYEELVNCLGRFWLEFCKLPSPQRKDSTPL